MTVVDGNMAVLQAAQRVFWSAGVKLSFAGSLAELSLVFETSGRPDLLILNAAEEPPGTSLAARIQRSGYLGRILAFVDGLGDGRARHLAQLPHGECVVRPCSEAGIDEILRKALPDSLQAQATRDRSPLSTSPAHHGIVGTSPKMREIFTRIEKVAACDANVCIHGESGTGKELIARAIHDASPRRDRPLVTLDCTTVPDGLMESHLLGHVRGAFTGAIEDRQGVFSLAHTGTLFIDELSELNLPLQAKLLRVVQNREFVRVGGSKPVRSDIRLITACNKDLKHEVERGAFREDLYYRVAVFMISVPPLRERREDIPLLVTHFLRKFSALYGKPIRSVEPPAMKRLLALPWPGNVRQLENVLEQAVVLSDGGTLTERELCTEDLSPPPDATAPYEPGLPLHEVERRHILGTLERVRGHRTEAARLLGISVRCLQYKLKEYAASGPKTAL